MSDEIGLQYSTRAGRMARTAVLLALTLMVVTILVVMLRDSAGISSTPAESIRPERGPAHKTGPWHYPTFGTRV